MPIWSDDFNRADGSLGANWTVLAGSPAISSNVVSGSATWYALAGPISAPGNAASEITVDWTNTGTNGLFPIVKCSDSTHWYAGWVTKNVGDLTFIIRSKNGAGEASLATYVLNGTPPASSTVRLTYTVGGTIILYNNGTEMCRATDTTHAAKTGVGLGCSTGSGKGDNFVGSGDGQKQLIVTPHIVGTEDGAQQLSVVGTSVTWTVGTPGTPSFTVSAGSNDGQTIVSTQTATVVFSPPASAQTVTLADPANSISTSIVVVDGHYTGAGGGGQLTQEALDWLEQQAAHGGLVIQEQESPSGTETNGFYAKGAFFELLAGKRTVAGTGTTSALDPGAIYQVWRNLNGGVDSIVGPYPEVSTSSVKEDTDFLRARWDSSVTPWTIEQVVAALAGDPLASHQDILTAISGITSGEVDLQPVLDAITALQGAEGATVDGAIQLIQALSTVAGYDLSTVRDWVEAVRGTGQPDLAAVMTKLGQVQPSTTYTLSSLNTQGVDLKNLLDLLALVIGVVAPEAGTVAELVSLIYDAVTTAAPAATNAGPPVWIDEQHATIDTPIALSDGLLLEGPMDGVIVTITGARAGAGKFAFGDVTSWRYCGAVVFGTDRGDWEWAQPIGLESQIVTCKTMQHASSALFRLESGFTGTAQPFTVTAGT